MELMKNTNDGGHRSLEKALHQEGKSVWFKKEVKT